VRFRRWHAHSSRCLPAHHICIQPPPTHAPSLSCTLPRLTPTALPPSIQCPPCSPQCGQGNGGNPGICGDTFQAETTDFASRYYGIQATYTAGQAIDVAFNFTANHAGRVSLRICPLPRDQVRGVPAAHLLL
jgi:hypothetical protein